MRRAASPTWKMIFRSCETPVDYATAARDAVKKEALRRAGIGYVEVVAGDTPAELRRVVERLVQRT